MEGALYLGRVYRMDAKINFKAVWFGMGSWVLGVGVFL